MRGLRTLLEVELKLLVREPITLVLALLYPLIVLFVLAEVFGTEVQRDDDTGEYVFRGLRPVDYYVPAYVGVVLASLGLISLPVHLASYRERGVLKRFRASGLPASVVVLAQIGATVIGAVVSSAVLVVAALLVYDAALPEQPAVTALAFLLGALEFGAIGTLLGMGLRTARGAQGAGLLMFFVMIFISGAGPPPEVIGDTLGAVSEVLPLTHCIRLLQDSWHGLEFDVVALAVTSAFTAGSFAFAVVFGRQ